MPFEPGKTMLHYRLVEKIGEGGMGQVWKAVDTTLDREVAIKVLPSDLSDDPDRLARFEREAKLLAALNHPNIAAIHSVHHHEGFHFLTMELVDGEDLKQRILHGRVPVDEAIDISRQIAEALETAHDRGVIHRDLKPANVKLTPEGQVKVLDFGLAKALDPTSPLSGSHDPALSPTLTSAGTMAGVILGTAGYMSPEQAKGKPVDRRADIWGLGMVLFEMLTGGRTFAGGSVPETLASVLKDEPDWSALPPLPRRLHELLRRCLDKNPRMRLRDAGEACVQLQLAVGETAEKDTADDGARPRAVPFWMPASFVLAILLGLAGGFVLWNVGGDNRALTRPLRVVLEDLSGPRAARGLRISPDGTHVAWLDSEALNIRPLNSLSSMRVTSDEPMGGFAWSPDSQEIAFSTREGGFYLVSRAGGPTRRVAEDDGAPTGTHNLAWLPDGRLVYADGETLRSIPARGGVSSVFVEASETTRHYHGVSALPGEHGVLTVRHATDGEPNTISIAREGRVDDILKLPWPVGHARYSPSGYLVFSRFSDERRSLWSVPFSLKSMKVLGEPTFLVGGGKDPTVGAEATLAYLHVEGETEHQLVWVDRSGEVQSIGRTHAVIHAPALSLDGKHVIYTVPGVSSESAVWDYDIAREVSTQFLNHDLGFGWGGDLGDGRVYVTSFKNHSTYVFPPSGQGDPVVITNGILVAVTGDQRYALVMSPADDDMDLYYIDLSGQNPSDLIPFRTGADRQFGGKFSSDGQWALYLSDKTGDVQLYLTRFPPTDEEWPVSVDGGGGGFFSSSGDEILFQSRSTNSSSTETVWRVSFTGEPEVRLGKPEKLLDLEGLNVSLTMMPGDQAGRLIGVQKVSSGNQQLILETGWISGR